MGRRPHTVFFSLAIISIPKISHAYLPRQSRASSCPTAACLPYSRLKTDLGTLTPHRGVATVAHHDLMGSG
uniref:Secreted protein n=1 Tax=Arundo donax TaxID=35708 RepID=A0A0A8Z520_ARUDO